MNASTRLTITCRTAVAACSLILLAACGAEVAPPSQDIERAKRAPDVGNVAVPSQDAPNCASSPQEARAERRAQCTP